MTTTAEALLCPCCGHTLGRSLKKVSCMLALCPECDIEVHTEPCLLGRGEVLYATSQEQEPVQQPADTRTLEGTVTKPVIIKRKWGIQ